MATEERDKSLLLFCRLTNNKNSWIEIPLNSNTILKRDDIPSDISENSILDTNFAVVGSYIYVVGGLTYKKLNGDFVTSNAIRRLDLRNTLDGWQTVHTMPFYCNVALLAVSGDLIYVFQGESSRFSLRGDKREHLPSEKWAYIYDIRDQTGEFLKKPADTRSSVVLVTAPVYRQGSDVAGILACLGSEEMYVHDPVSDNWYSYSAYCGKEVDNVIPHHICIDGQTVSEDGILSYLQFDLNSRKPIITSYDLREGRLQFQCELDFMGFDDSNGGNFNCLVEVCPGKIGWLNCAEFSDFLVIYYTKFSVSSSHDSTSALSIQKIKRSEMLEVEVVFCVPI